MELPIARYCGRHLIALHLTRTGESKTTSTCCVPNANHPSFVHPHSLHHVILRLQQH